MGIPNRPVGRAPDAIVRIVRTKGHFLGANSRLVRTIRGWGAPLTEGRGARWGVLGLAQAGRLAGLGVGRGADFGPCPEPVRDDRRDDRTAGHIDQADAPRGDSSGAPL